MIYGWAYVDLDLLSPRENSMFPCDESHGKGAYLHGKAFAVRSRTVTTGRQRYRRQRILCRAHRRFTRQSPLPCTRWSAVRHTLCRATPLCRAYWTLPCDSALPCGDLFAMRVVVAVRPGYAVKLALPCAHLLARTAKALPADPPGAPRRTGERPPTSPHVPLFWGEEGENDRRSTGTPPNLACGPMICVNVWFKV
jgi:hypothetical protein